LFRGGDQSLSTSVTFFGKSAVDVALVLNPDRIADMVFERISRSLVTRFFAALIVVLVLSPYSAPFATIDGTDFSCAGAVDIDGASKLKAGTQDLLVVPAIVAVGVGVTTKGERPILSSPMRAARLSQRTILRL
jgi:hypothetical protein